MMKYSRVNNYKLVNYMLLREKKSGYNLLASILWRVIFRVKKSKQTLFHFFIFWVF